MKRCALARSLSLSQAWHRWSTDVLSTRAKLHTSTVRSSSTTVETCVAVVGGSTGGKAKTVSRERGIIVPLGWRETAIVPTRTRKENQLKILRPGSKLASVDSLKSLITIPPEFQGTITERCESGRIGQSRKLLSG